MDHSEAPRPSDLRPSAPVLHDVENGRIRSSQSTIVEPMGGSGKEARRPSGGIETALTAKKRGLTEGDQGQRDSNIDISGTEVHSDMMDIPKNNLKLVIPA